MPRQTAEDAVAKTSEGRAAVIEELISDALEAMGFEIVRVLLSGDRQVKLQIMIERTDGEDVSVDDCAEASRMIAAILDVNDPISASYTLEVSSPGLERPLTRLRDFERFRGYEAKVELARAIDGRRRFQGRVAGVGPEARVRLTVEEEELSFPFSQVVKARLVITDDIFARGGRRAKDQAGND